MATYTVKAPDGKTVTLQGPDGASNDEVIAQAQKLYTPQTMAQQMASENSPLKGLGDAALHIGSGMVMLPLSGLAGLVTGGNADAVKAVQGMQYQPRTATGKLISNAVAWPFEKLAEGANYVGEHVADATRPVLGDEYSSRLGGDVNAAIQGLPAALAAEFRASPVDNVSKLGANLGKGAEATPKAETPGAAAQAWAKSNNLDWSSLADQTRQQLTKIAESAKDLSNLDPAQVARGDRLAKMGIPATRGDVTRDLAQITKEENIQKTDIGQPLMQTKAAQDEALYKNLDLLKNQFNPNNVTDTSVGAAIQDAALRKKLKASQANVSQLYKAADASAEGAQPVDVSPLMKYIKDSVGEQHLTQFAGNLKKFGKTTAPEAPFALIDTKGNLLNPTQEASTTTIPLRKLEEIRKDVSTQARTSNDGSARYWAGQFLDQIDNLTENSGGELYAKARAARKAQAAEFENQGIIKRLSSEKPNSVDRRVALEDTFNKTVVNGNLEDIGTIKQSLLQGGNATTRTAGEKAWQDLQARTIQYLKEGAEGNTQPQNILGKTAFSGAGYLRAIDKIGYDKLDAIFGPEVVGKLKEFEMAVRDVRTKPNGHVAGSDSIPRLMSFLNGLGKLPVVGKFARGAVQKGAEIYQSGKAAEDVKNATTSPMQDAIDAANKAAVKRNKAARNANATRRGLLSDTTAQGDNKRRGLLQ